MKANKILLGGVVGTVVYFLIGALVMGMLLSDYYTANTNQCFMKPQSEMNMVAIFISTLASGFLTAFIMGWSNTTNAMAGARIGGITGLLLCITYDLMFYSISNMYNNTTIIIVDIVVGTLTTAVGGAVVAWVMGMGKKADA